MIDRDEYKQFAAVREIERGSVTLHVFGDVDLASAGDFVDAIDEAAAMCSDSVLLINLSRCRYFDSSGLAALARARRLLGTKLTVQVKSHSQILRVMQLVGFTDLFHIVTELQVDVNLRHRNHQFESVDLV